MSKRSCVPKWIKREKMPVGKETEATKKSNKSPMSFNKRDARKPRPAQNKGRGQQGGYWGHE